MTTGKGLHSKMRKLLQLTWPTQRKFAESVGIAQGTVNEYFSRGSNITLKNFLKILDGLGIDIESLVDQAIRSAIGDKQVFVNQDNDDIATLVNSLDKHERRAFIQKAVALQKSKRTISVDVLERIEKRQLFH